MEGENVEMGSSGGTPASSRWNPTKEQISMLENLYTQGIRTPSAEQIQQITGRLKAYGHIEGKNVFYWFQNHKARQRQKQKQESLAYINRFFHKNQTAYPPPFPNVGCPYYLPQSHDLGFYPQYPKVVLPGGFKRRPRTEKIIEKTRSCAGSAEYEPANNQVMMQIKSSNINQETLDLFPLHPTGIVEERREKCSVASSTSTTPTSSENTGIEEGSGDQPFFDFFSGQGQGSCQSIIN